MLKLHVDDNLIIQNFYYQCISIELSAIRVIGKELILMIIKKYKKIEKDRNGS